MNPVDDGLKVDRPAAEGQPSRSVEVTREAEPDSVSDEALTVVTESYDAKNISVLEGLAAVRKRPDMYIGGTDASGLHHLVYEALDNSIDEALAGHCRGIQVRLDTHGFASVTDDGRGIPVDEHSSGKSALEVVMTVLHAGGKFDNKSYKVSGGLHGVGVSVVCALSEKLEVDVHRGGIHYRQEYERGVPTGPVEQVGPSAKRGTKVRFKPDPEIFETTEFQYEALSKRCRELAFLNKGLKISIEDEVVGKEDVFHYEEGIKAFVRHQNSKKEPLHPDIFHIHKTDPEGRVILEVALQYNKEYSSENIYTFANNINTIHGGTHLSGFKSALTRTLNRYARENKLVKDNDVPPDGTDYLEGLVAVVSVKLPDPKFESQTKVKLSNTEIEGIVQQIVNEQLAICLEESPASGKAILNKALQARAAREAARKARDLARRKTVLSSGNLPGKLADCSSRDPWSTELYIVEGDSAGGSAKMGRIREYQAILPIRGKILNVEKTRIDKMLGHAEIQTIISALGTGIGQDDFDVSKLRYGKIIIMTDADVDGSHIRTLLLTFFFRQMAALIEEGHIYIAQPPLYELLPKRGSKKSSQYIQDDHEYEELVLALGIEGTSVSIEGTDISFSGARLEQLCRAIGKMQLIEIRFRRKGVSLPRLLAEGLSSKGKLPEFLVLAAARGGEDPRHHFFASEAGLEEFLNDERSGREKPLKVAQDVDDLEKRERADLVVHAMSQEDSLANLLAELRTLGLSARSYRLAGNSVAVAGQHVELEPLARVRLPGSDEVVIHDLVGILKAVQGVVEKGYEVKRFKGLGEMNPDQLFETTMDPEHRTLLKVTINDAYKADEYFSILMGNDVESRRKFIQTYALDVKNLDI